MPNKKLTDVTDNNVGKITDAEIVKALGYAKEMEMEDVVIYYEDVCTLLDIINRLQAENERLKGEQPLVITNCEATEDTLELLKKNKTVNILDDEARIEFVDEKSIKAEAYKEFWDELKKHSRKMQSSDFSGEFWDAAILVEDGNNLLKEWVGDN